MTLSNNSKKIPSDYFMNGYDIMLNTQIDNKSFQFLKYVYEHDEISIKEFPEYINANNKLELFPLMNTVLSLFSYRYLSVYNPKLQNIMYSISYEKYLSACENNSIAYLDPNCIIAILPKGRAYVEERLRQQEEFSNLQRIANASLEHSETAKQQAEIAKENSKSSARYALISVVISVLAFLTNILTIVAQHLGWIKL